MALSTIKTASIANDAITADKIINDGNLGVKNLIINGAMQVAQRGTSGTSANGYNSVDRFKNNAVGFDQLALTQSQSTETPNGFSNSMKIDCTTAETTIDADEYWRVQQFIEAQNLQHLQYGTSGTKSVTLSFWVRSNLTGDYAVSLYQNDDVRVIGSTYTINSADTWEYKTITFAGDTVGVIDNDNGAGLTIDWFLSAGSNQTSTDNTSWAAWAFGRMAYGHNVNMASSASNEWYITSVQLELGETATPFEHRSFGDELARCQRYHQKIDLYSSNGGVANSWYFQNVNFLTEMRAAPTLPKTSAYGLDTGYASMTQGGSTVNGLRISNSTTTQAIVYGLNTDLWQTLNGRLHFDAEL